MTKNKLHTNYQGFTSPNCFLMGNLNITNCTFTNNTASNNGGGIYINESNPKIYNCTIADNEADNQTGYAGGVYFDWNYSSPEFRNTIAWWNIPALSDVKNNGSNPLPTQGGTYNYCDFRNFATVALGNINGDPLFVDHANGDYRISKTTGAGSPCIDKGFDGISGFTYPDYDIRGTGFDRKVDIYGYSNEIDMGAFEYEYDDPNDPRNYKIAKYDSNSIDFENFEMIVYPNPAESYYSLLFYAETEGEGSVQLYNSVGKVVLSHDLNVNEGENYYQFTRDDLSDGIYYLQLRLQLGNTRTMKLIFN